MFVLDDQPRSIAHVRDAGCSGPGGDDLLPHHRRYPDLAEQRREHVGGADSREQDERRAVADDDHGASTAARRKLVKLAPEVVEVVVDGIEAVLAGQDEEVVQPHS